MDFTIFENIADGDECDGDQVEECKSVDRIIAALEYYEHLVLSPFAAKYGDDPRLVFDGFCRDLYPKKTLLNDYIHWVLNHNDSDALMHMRQRLHFLCESAKHCGATARHYRDRRDDGNDADKVESSWYTDKIDCIHFNIRHLHEVGLRVSAETLLSETAPDDDQEDGSERADDRLKRMKKEIASKRSAFSNQRLDGANNAKFTMKIANLKDVRVQGVSIYIFCVLFAHFMQCSIWTKCPSEWLDAMVSKCPLLQLKK